MDGTENVSTGKIDSFLKTVQEQIRCKKARETATAEIREHLEEERAFLLQSGIDDPEATEKAIREMGDPVDIGLRLDRVHRPRMDWKLFAGVLFLCVLGLMLQYSVRSFSGIQNALSPFGKQIFSCLLGIGCMYLICRIDYTYLAVRPRILWIGYIGVLILIAVLTPTVNGGHPQAIPLLLPCIPLFGGVLYSYRNKGVSGIIRCILFLIPACYACLLMPSISALLILSFSSLLLLTAAIWRHWFGVKRGPALAALWGGGFLVTIGTFLNICLRNPEQYQAQRLMSILSLADHESYIQTIIHQLLSEAPLLGFVDTPNLQKMPDLASNYLLVYVAARFGLLAAAAIVFLLVLLLIYLFQQSFRQTNVLACLVSLGCSLALALETLLYLTVNLGILPVGTLQLPFLSHGGVFTIVNLCLIGLVLSIYRHRMIGTTDKRAPSPSSACSRRNRKELV